MQTPRLIKSLEKALRKYGELPPYKKGQLPRPEGRSLRGNP